MALSVDEVRELLDGYKWPRVGNGKAAPADEWVDDKFGRRGMLLWATTVRWQIKTTEHTAKELLEDAVGRYKVDMTQEAKRAGCAPSALVTSPLAATPVRVDDAGLWAEFQVYGRVENVEGRSK